ncbi:splicing factor 3A subunit 1-like [Dendronephthya gigantea]|uniref:splicing factor 3A subunit 1-like n=1 Tax=Dendronephthya gigantea TaxID=151771 RepID=UPI00106D2310|nr:splicing factor 3A subunit 1-like [Dendronephthya gigantea]
MPPVSATTEENKDGSEPAPSKPTIGIIYPPPEVRNIVDKTASFVARNGPEFQTRIRQNEQNNPKFNFLNTGDPYHAYYQHKVKEFKENEGKIPEPVIQPLMSIPTTKIKPAVTGPQMTIVEPEVPTEPPPEYEFLADPPSISSLDLDIVKLTAQFVARNGRQFLTNLMNREQRNYQFDFLRPQHSLFNYFTKLVEQYTKVLIPPGNIKERLKEKTEDPFKILENVNYRVRWARHREQEKQKVEDEKEKERVSFAQIDWHDFVVVETVEFKDNEMGNLPPPVTLEQLGARILDQERSGTDKGKDMEGETKGKDDEYDMMDIEMEDEDESQPPPPPKDTQRDNRPPSPPRPQEPPPPQPPLPPMAPGTNIQIRKDYNPKQVRAPGTVPPDNYLISPITGERVPPQEFDEHMKISLLDPKWKEQRDRFEAEKKQQETVFASGSSMESNLKHIAERRTDIFGKGDVETFIGQKFGEEDVKQPEKVTWDGHTASISATAQKAAAGISLEEQIEQIHKQIGMVPDKEKEAIGPKPSNNPPPPPPHMQLPRPPPLNQSLARPPPPPGFPSMPNMPRMPPLEQRNQPPPPQMMRPPVPPPQRFMGIPPPMQPPPFIRPDVQAAPPVIQPDEPAAKKSKVDAGPEANLIPENIFLQKHQGSVRFQVQVPDIPDKTEWKCQGQKISLTLPWTDPVSVIKAKLHEEIGMPAGKQKLQLESMFIKDSNTLAYYNFSPASVVQLQVKERGGRKK